MPTDIRLKFSRKGPVKYLGHLDNMRYFQKAILRAGIDIKYSEGFNPHQILSFAYPLGVSMETEGDYADITINDGMSASEIKERLNSVMNEGFEIEEAYVLPEGALNAMASVAAADYRVYFDETLTEEDIKNFMKLPEILVVKEGKKSTNTIDIKPGIYKLETIEGGLFMFLASGSTLNIKPIQIIDALNEFLNKTITLTDVVRVNIYRQKADGNFTGLGEF